MKRILLTVLILSFFVFMSACSQKGPDKDAVKLWNGTDFSGWERYIPCDSVDVNSVWSVTEGAIHCQGVPTGYMRTVDDYSDFILTLEWRWLKLAGNSGVLLYVQEPDQVWPNCVECQLKSGHAGDFVLIGPGSITVDEKEYENTEQFLVIPKKYQSNEKPIGEWNQYKIVSENNTITCYVNGVKQNYGINPSLSMGKIALQSEGIPIEFKNIFIKKL